MKLSPSRYSLSNATRLAAICASLLLATLARAAEKNSLSYNRDIRPILSDNCFYCHGPDKSHQKGKFRLDDFASAVKKGAIVPGKPDDSTLVDRIYTNDPDDHMPPAETHKKLSDAQKETLKRWIAQGAEYQAFWAYVAPRRAAVPAVKDSAWVRNPVDSFVLQGLEAKGLAPSREADRRTLLRRLSLDVIGLPPTPQEEQTFIDDASPGAYERQVDRLLASPRYGERMAVPWLDAVRFADTVGFHGDQNVNVFPYRDYVIDSFNRDKPFDQFTIEQLAGDLLEHPTEQQLVASGYNRLNMVTREGGAQPKEYLAKYAADRVRTLASTWLGSTMGCCECHDHKFDPFLTRDFYSMGAFWADLKQWGVYGDYSYTPNPDLKGFSNDHPFPPEIVAASPYLARRQARLQNLLNERLNAAAARLLADPRRAIALDAWIGASRRFLAANADGWAGSEQTPPSKTHPATGPSASEIAQAGASKSVKAAKAKSKAGDPRQSILRPEAGVVAAIRVEVLPGAEKMSGLGNGSQRAGLRLTVTLKPKTGPERNLSIYHADADFKEPRYSNGAELIGVTGGWKLSASHAGERQTSIWLLDPPVAIREGDELRIATTGDTSAPIEASWSPFAAADPLKTADETFRQRYTAANNGQSPASRKSMAADYLVCTAADAEAFAEYKSLLTEVLECRDGKSPAVVSQAREPLVTHILRRGNWQDEGGAIVEPAVPHFLPQPPAAGHRRLNRLDLAKWLVSPENPLTARTFVNRTWKQFFGTGICASVDDLGSQGEYPAHPELLDWLAVEFRESGWDVKHLVKLMVTSATYRQDSSLQPGLHEIDPANRLLASQSPRRLQAEFVRDNALAAAGLLNVDDVGGPSMFPYQPAGYYANIQFPSRDWIADTDDQQYRRGVYVHWQRTFLHPMLANFNAPSREDTACTRVVSNTPQQALTLLNDPTFVEAARVLAEHAMSAASDERGRLQFIYQRAVCRAPQPRESDSLLDFLRMQRDYYRANLPDAVKLLHVGNAPVADGAELAAWAMVCRAILNLHETITRY